MVTAIRQSKRFGALSRRKDELRKALLPNSFDPLGNYSASVREQALAYSILIHAELEAYFEDWSLKLLDRALAAWKSGRVSVVVMSVVAFSTRESCAITYERFQGKKGNSNETANSLVRRACEEFRRRIGANHGIKPDNLLELLCRLGLSESDFDQTWMAAMNSFGELRGKYAHNSRIGVKVLVDPRAEFDRVEHLFPELALLDGRLVGLNAKISGR